MKKGAREIKFFLFSQELSDGLRITLAILLPALILSFNNQLLLGMTFSLGALCVSVTDAPGPLVHKRNSMAFGLLFTLITAFITGFARMHPFLLGLEIFILSFLYSMFAVYGARAGAVGSTALLILILTMDQPLQPSQVLPHTLTIAAGGIWYLLISLTFYIIRPYRPAQRALGQCLRELSKYIAIKADFYNPDTNLEEDYRKLVAQHIIVTEKQDAVREHLFKSRQIVKETTKTSSALLLTFIDAVDMFEEVTATYYDYKAIRTQYADQKVLKSFSNLIKEIAAELDEISVAVQSNTPYTKKLQADVLLDNIKEEIDVLGSTGVSNVILKKVLVNCKRLIQRIHDMADYFNPAVNSHKKSRPMEVHRFVTQQSFDPQIFANNFTFQSSIFRHSLRVAIACIIGYAITQVFTYGQHSYWILLTIAFILKPAYSLTKQRNVERIMGTVAGGLIGIAILVFIKNTTAQFCFMVLFMLGTYTFQRTNYIAMVFCVTPFVLILFKFVGVGFIDVAQERVIDTVIGCAIAFTASYVLFPKWEKEQLKDHLLNMLKANKDYLQIFYEKITGKDITTVDFKLVRKEVYVSSANLSATFQRMLSEPKDKQTATKEVHQFVVLNHILFSNIAAFTSGVRRTAPYPASVVRLVRRVLSSLCNILQQLDAECTVTDTEQALADKAEKKELTGDDALLKDQLEFILKISTDLDKITGKIMAAA